MKSLKIALLIFITASILQPANSGPEFDTYFTGRTMRIDYHHFWEGKGELISLDKIYREGEWAGSRTKLIDQFKYGKYRVKLISENGDKIIFSRGFDSYFGEYATTGKALKGIRKAYHETALVPYPKSKCTFTIEKYSPSGKSQLLHKGLIDPGSVNIIEEKPDSSIRVFNVHKSGHPSKRMDLAIVAEGYTAAEEKKAGNDFEKVKKIFLSQEPYLSMKDRINIRGLFKPSEESGPDEPRVGKFRNTSVDTTFNSLGSPRYLLTEANKKLRDITAAAPCDAIMIMVNSARYGGGGIYNSFCTFTIDNEQAGYLILHEFGHSFSGLADEYYSSSVAYNEFYPRGTEPAEPNITALLDKSELKWAGLVKKGTKIPTNWRKAEFDRMNTEFGKKRKAINLKIEKLSTSGAPAAEIKKAKREIELLMLAKEKENREFFKKTGRIGVVGVYEGAGYSSEGLYRPMVDCIMFTIGQKPYCAVCEEAVRTMIKKYTD
ncbi:MAG: M64 family metallopeptidase [Acidobacteriota bacterium]